MDLPMSVDEYMEENEDSFIITENVFDNDDFISYPEDLQVCATEPMNDIDRNIEELNKKLK